MGTARRQRFVGTVYAALDAGINFFDSAPGCGIGHAERVLGQALEGRRHEAVIATKVVKLAPADVERLCDDSLLNLKTYVIDLYQIDWPDHKIALEETVAALHRLKYDGKVRAVGVNNLAERTQAGR